MENNKEIQYEWIFKLSIPLNNAWELYVLAEHISKWNCYSDDWYCPLIINELKKGGMFFIRMETKNGKDGFDLIGHNNVIEPFKRIERTFRNGIRITTLFRELNSEIEVSIRLEVTEKDVAKINIDNWLIIFNHYISYAKKYHKENGKVIYANANKTSVSNHE